MKLLSKLFNNIDFFLKEIPHFKNCFIPDDFPNAGKNHELLERTYLISDMFDRYITENNLIKLDPDLKLAAEKASNALGDLYQAVGGKVLK